MTILGVAEILGLTQIASILANQQQLAYDVPQHVLSSVIEKKQAQKYEYQYDPSPIEQYYIDNAQSLDLFNTQGVATCPIVLNASSPIHTGMTRYYDQLKAYNTAVNRFTPLTHDLRVDIHPDGGNIEEVCQAAK